MSSLSVLPAKVETASDGIIGGTEAHRSVSWVGFLDLTLDEGNDCKQLQCGTAKPMRLSL